MFPYSVVIAWITSSSEVELYSAELNYIHLTGIRFTRQIQIILYDSCVPLLIIPLVFLSFTYVIGSDSSIIKKGCPKHQP